MRNSSSTTRMRWSSIRTRAPACALIVFQILALIGCRTRCDYRHWADSEVAQALSDKQCDDRWVLPARAVEADSRSRMADPNCPDCGPLPPDDPAAHCFMHFPDRMCGWPYWHECGDLPLIEFPEWQNYLPVNENGKVRLNRETAIELSRVHSREYQDRVEQMYFTALAFTLERFEFSTQWFARTGPLFNVFSNHGSPTESRLLTQSSNVGFSQNLAIGGQLLVDFANAFVWEFAGGTTSSASSGLLVSLTQPLLRGAFRQVRLENLTQAERNLLYDVRDFARFRRVFYVDIVGSGYLPLLALAQSIKNQEKNLKSLERNLEEHEQLVRAGLVAPIQVDQVFQQYQQGRLSVLSAQQALANALDQFKLALGLPPQLEIELDEEALEPFELNDPEIDALQKANEEFRLELVQLEEVPSLEEIKRYYERLKTQLEKAAQIKKKLEGEFATWQRRLKRTDKRLKSEERDSPDTKEPSESTTAAEEDASDERERHARQVELAKRLNQVIEELEGLAEDDLECARAGAEGKWIRLEDVDEEDRELLEDEARRPQIKWPIRLLRWQQDQDSTVDSDSNREGEAPAEPSATIDSDSDSAGASPSRNALDDDSPNDDSPARKKPKRPETDDELDDESRREELWKNLKEIVGRRYRKQLADLFVMQAQIRVYLIESNPIEIDEHVAVAAALRNRLDLMNARANVVDAYRGVEVAADALEAELNLQFAANLGTDPNRSNPFRFDASANRYTVGFEFDSPVTRLVERNLYRAAQIQYQQARRDYMALKDNIVAAVRRDLRQVRFNKFSFEITKLQLLTAARQVDEAQLNLRNSNEPNSSFTRNLLEALQGLLAAKNNLIQSWVGYEASRMALYRDLEVMEIATDGTWINDTTIQTEDDNSSDAAGDILFSDDLLSEDRDSDGQDAEAGRSSDEFERDFIDNEPDTSRLDKALDELFDEPAGELPDPQLLDLGTSAPPAVDTEPAP